MYGTGQTGNANLRNSQQYVQKRGGIGTTAGVGWRWLMQ